MMFQADLDEAFPASSDANVIRAVSEGIMMADSMLRNEPFMMSLVGQDLRGHVRRAGILFRLHSMSQAGDIPFTSAMKQMPRGSWHWVELRSGRFTAHVCRTEGASAFPVDTPTRQDDRLSNQFELFDNTPTVVPMGGHVAWLTFGATDNGQVGHLCWGMPSAKDDVWLARSNILRRTLEADGRVIEPEAQSKAIALKFRDHVEQALKNNSAGRGQKPA